MADVIFAAFDEKTGPVAVFSTFKDSVLTKKIAVKSIVSTLTSVRSSVSERIEGEAILPFPNENLKAFIFYTTLDQKTEGGEYRVISLSAVVTNEKSSSLYANATMLSKAALEIKDALNNDYTFGQPLSPELVSKLEGWGKLTETQELEVIAEKEIRFGLRSLFELFLVKKGLRSYSDPLEPLFIGILAKIPVVFVAPNVEFSLEITDVIRELIPEGELDVRLSISLEQKSQTFTSKIPRADIILLDEKQDKKKNFYNDPVTIVGIGRESSYVNYSVPEKVSKTISKILKKAREIPDETVATHYLKGELLSFSTKLDNLKNYCLSGRKGKVKDFAKAFSVSEEYILTLAEALRTRMDVSAQEINQMFEGSTAFKKMELRSLKNIGFIR